MQLLFSLLATASLVCYSVLYASCCSMFHSTKIDPGRPWDPRPIPQHTERSEQLQDPRPTNTRYTMHRHTRHTMHPRHTRRARHTMHTRHTRHTRRTKHPRRTTVGTPDALLYCRHTRHTRHTTKVFGPLSVDLAGVLFLRMNRPRNVCHQSNNSLFVRFGLLRMAVPNEYTYRFGVGLTRLS